EAELGESFERSGERRRRLPETTGDLGESMTPGADEREDGRCLRHVAHVVEQKALGLLVEHSERIEDVLHDGAPPRSTLACDLPIAGHASPSRPCSDRVVRVV